MEGDRPAKRIRQACEPCRRKKGKCSGDRPACSTCARLGQMCYYYGHQLQFVSQETTAAPDFTPVEVWPLLPAHGAQHVPSERQEGDERAVASESSSNHLARGAFASPAHGVSNLNISPHQQNQPADAEVVKTSASTSSTSASLSRKLRQLQEAELRSLTSIYIRHYHCQPLQIFPVTKFGELQRLDDSVLLGIVALCLRHVQNLGSLAYSTDSKSSIEAARSLVVSEVALRPVRISTLQAACLVALYDLTAGRVETALSMIHLGSMLVANITFSQSAPPWKDKAIEEQACCYWSMVLLRRLLGLNAPMSLVLVVNPPCYPPSCSIPALGNLRAEYRQGYQDSNGDNGIMVFVYEMSSEWVNVVDYARHFMNRGADCSPWLTTSRYNSVLSGVMSIETRLQPHLHRIKHVNFRSLTLQDLEGSREYWAPWLLSRFLYHTMICLLNHPLLILLQLQGKKDDSELFRQQTSFYAAHHVRWILYFLAFIEARAFPISDPLLGRCAAIVATIELQLMYCVGPAAAEKKKRNFESCRRTIQRLASTCQSMADMDRKLLRLEVMMGEAFAAESNQGNSITVDLSCISAILDMCSSSAREFAADATPTAHTDVPSHIPQWTRLSRRPSIDQPDDEVSPAPVSIASEFLPLLIPPEITSSRIDAIQTASSEATLHEGNLDFPAYILFNGVSQDEVEWWSSFDLNDPGWPAF